MKIANRFGIPVCTIPNRGMFVYDPATRKTTKLHDGLDWLIPSKPDSIVAKRRGVSVVGQFQVQSSSYSLLLNVHPAKQQTEA